MALASEIPLASFGSHFADLPGDGLLLQQELQEARSVVPSLLPGSVVVVEGCSPQAAGYSPGGRVFLHVHSHGHGHGCCHHIPHLVRLVRGWAHVHGSLGD